MPPRRASKCEPAADVLRDQPLSQQPPQTKPLPSKTTTTVADGDHHRSLRGRSKTKKGADGPATKGIAGLKDRRESKWGFFATIRFADGQEAEALADTGSADLWLPSTLCPDCNKVWTAPSRACLSKQSIRPHAHVT